MKTETADLEIKQKKRFAFGKNWANFLKSLDEERIAEAQRSLAAMLGVDSLEGVRFLDAGSGSGLFSLAAYRMGANVYSFDYDPMSVKCTEELKQRYHDGRRMWDVSQGNLLDKEWLESLGHWDVVYSWGVLHHTGAMYEAMENIVPLVRNGGRLFISIYNDQGRRSKLWRFIKKTYSGGSFATKSILLAVCFPVLWGRGFVRGTIRKFNPLHYWSEYKKHRGMSPWHDVVDWVGGYPFEVAKPEEIFDFYYSRGFSLTRLFTCAGGLGCNQFVFTRHA